MPTCYTVKGVSDVGYVKDGVSQNQLKVFCEYSKPNTEGFCYGDLFAKEGSVLYETFHTKAIKPGDKIELDFDPFDKFPRITGVRKVG